jgi:predicted Zn-dependent peptidase
MSSRLFVRLREELGVCYYVYASQDSFTDHGAFMIAAGVTNERVHEVVDELLKECKKLRTDMVSPAELAKAKEYLIGNMKLELESSDAWANFYGSQEIMRKAIKDPEMLEKRIRAVTAKDIQKVAQEIFVDKGLNLAVIGPWQDAAPFQKQLSFN